MRITAGGTHHVECGRCLREESVPKVHWKVRVCAAQTCNEMVFPCPDGSLGGIASMHVGWYKLEIDVVGSVVIF